MQTHGLLGLAASQFAACGVVRSALRLHSRSEGLGGRYTLADTPTERDDEAAWAKLSRRKVVQWGLAYAAGARALLEVVGFAAERFNGRT